MVLKQLLTLEYLSPIKDVYAEDNRDGGSLQLTAAGKLKVEEYTAIYSATDSSKYHRRSYHNSEEADCLQWKNWKNLQMKCWQDNHRGHDTEGRHGNLSICKYSFDIPDTLTKPTG